MCHTASWVIREIATGKVILETFERKTAEAVNAARYEAVSIQQHLAELNRSIKRSAAPN